MISTSCPQDKKVVLATDSNPTYLFFAPITALVWKKYIRYTPIVLMIGKEEDYQNNPLSKLCIDTLKSVASDIYFIEPIEKLKTGNMAQLSRLYCGCLDLPDTTYLLTSDIDMWPLSISFFQQQNWNKEMHIFYANAYNRDKFPICYCGAKSSTWRNIMKIEKGSICDEIKKQIEADIGYESPDMWTYDEVLLSRKIKEWSGYEQSCQMIDRSMTEGMPNGRIDRSCWRYNAFNHKLIDAHLLRPGETPSNWKRIEVILKRLINANDFKSMVSYKDDFIRISNGQ